MHTDYMMYIYTALKGLSREMDLAFDAGHVLNVLSPSHCSKRATLPKKPASPQKGQCGEV
jgi:hypothetical protein